MHPPTLTANTTILGWQAPEIVWKNRAFLPHERSCATGTSCDMYGAGLVILSWLMVHLQKFLSSERKSDGLEGLQQSIQSLMNTFTPSEGLGHEAKWRYESLPEVIEHLQRDLAVCKLAISNRKQQRKEAREQREQLILAFNLVSQLVQVEDTERLSASSALQHPFVQQQQTEHPQLPQPISPNCLLKKSSNQNAAHPNKRKPLTLIDSNAVGSQINNFKTVEKPIVLHGPSFTA